DTAIAVWSSRPRSIMRDSTVWRSVWMVTSPHEILARLSCWIPCGVISWRMTDPKNRFSVRRRRRADRRAQTIRTATDATESFGRPVARLRSRTVPGASAHFRLLVKRGGVRCLVFVGACSPSGHIRLLSYAPARSCTTKGISQHQPGGDGCGLLLGTPSSGDGLPQRRRRRNERRLRSLEHVGRDAVEIALAPHRASHAAGGRGVLNDLAKQLPLARVDADVGI